MGTDSNHCGFNKKQRRMAYQSSPKKKQRTITVDGSTGITIRMGNNSTGNVCKVCRAKAARSVIPHSAHDRSASNCSLYDGGNSKTKPKQKNMTSFLNTKAVSSIVPPPYATRASNNVAVNTNTNNNNRHTPDLRGTERVVG